jgi:GNAT superfamily N-acetyltransferase
VSALRRRINLNYVSPDARFRGVSRALLRAPEASVVARGNVRCTLTSTETAQRFYTANGYIENGPPVGNFGMSSGLPIARLLTQAGLTMPQSGANLVRSGERSPA